MWRSIKISPYSIINTVYVSFIFIFKSFIFFLLPIQMMSETHRSGTYVNGTLKYMLADGLQNASFDATLQAQLS